MASGGTPTRGGGDVQPKYQNLEVGTSSQSGLGPVMALESPVRGANQAAIRNAQGLSINLFLTNTEDDSIDVPSSYL